MSDDMPIRPAATVIIVRDGAEGPESLETLLVRRSAGLAFHGGSWVFPGGRIDDEDFPATAAGGPDRGADAEAAARAAALREARGGARPVIHPPPPGPRPRGRPPGPRRWEGRGGSPAWPSPPPRWCRGRTGPHRRGAADASPPGSTWPQPPLAVTRSWSTAARSPITAGSHPPRR